MLIVVCENVEIKKKTQKTRVDPTCYLTKEYYIEIKDDNTWGHYQ